MEMAPLRKLLAESALALLAVELALALLVVEDRRRRRSGYPEGI